MLNVIIVTLFFGELYYDVNYSCFSNINTYPPIVFVSQEGVQLKFLEFEEQTYSLFNASPLKMMYVKFQFHFNIYCNKIPNYNMNSALQISGRLCLMESSTNTSDKKTLKRWFFIDKRVG